MLTISQTGIPGIICGKCFEPVPISSAVVQKHPDLSSVIFICIDCAEILSKTYPNSAFIEARTFFEALLAVGRPKRVMAVGS